MGLKGFHRVILPGILLAFLCCVSAVGDLNEYRCPYNIHVQKRQIIKARESQNNGARFLKHATVLDARECYKLCCERESCDLAQMQYKNSSSSGEYSYFDIIEKICYMFHCGTPSKCRFGEHDHYATISYERPDRKLSNLDGDQFEIPSKNVNPPALKVKSQYRPSQPDGDSEEEEDLESNPYDSYKPPSRQQANKYEEHKDLHASWKAKPEGQNTGYPKAVKEFGKATYHTKTTKKPTAKASEEDEQPVYQEVVPKKPEKPAKHVEVETNEPVIPIEKVKEESKQVQPPSHQDADDVDAELETKLEEIVPPPEKVTQPPTFHQWRDFVDNNPNFPYTIPVNHKKTTQKPTTKKQQERPKTQHHTTEKTTKKTVKTEQPPKTTQKTTTVKKTKSHEDKSQDEETPSKSYAKPPVIELPLPHKNVSDVVVIETRRLRIIENKAVLPLAIFLVLAILLLFVVALRLRIVKSKLKRRPFATDDADYLINGMYL